jgi:spore coat protein CotH
MLRDRFRLILVLAALLAVPATASWAQPVPPPDPSDPFFDDTVVHDIRLQINTKDWESLKVNYLDNTVYPCYFLWTNQTVRNVGIRSRGLGSRSGIKPGLRVDFDYYTTDQKFLGLKSVILRNNTQDASNMRERASMLFFRRMGVTASREAHARLFINSDYAGVYTIVESIDKNFLQKNFGENDGHLYEYRFDTAAPLPFDFGYRGPDPALYAPLPFKPQTRENDPQGQVLERLFWTANQAGSAVWRTAMEEFLEMKRFLKHVAIEVFLADQDGIAGDYGPNNFYLYRFQNKNLFLFLPWDKSQAFWESPSPNYSILRNIEEGQVTHRNRLVARALTDTELREFYLDTLLACADLAVEPAANPAGSEPLGWLEAEILREYEQIRAAVRSDTTKLSTNEEFETAVADIRTFTRLRTNNIREQVAADRARRGQP